MEIQHFFKVKTFRKLIPKKITENPMKTVHRLLTIYLPALFTAVFSRVVLKHRNQITICKLRDITNEASTELPGLKNRTEYRNFIAVQFCEGSSSPLPCTMAFSTHHKINFFSTQRLSPRKCCDLFRGFRGWGFLSAGLYLSVGGERFPGSGVLKLAELLLQLNGLHHHTLHLIIIANLHVS